METCCNCKLCKYAQVIPYEWSEDGSENYDDYFCNHSFFARPKSISMYVLPEDKHITPPKWCPLKHSKQETMSELPKERLSYSEMIANMKALKPSIEWENIEEGVIYHVPPMGREKRLDVYVESRTPYLLRTRLLNLLTGEVLYSRVFYKNSDERWMRFVKHKVLDVASMIDIEKIKSSVNSYNY